MSSSKNHFHHENIRLLIDFKIYKYTCFNKNGGTSLLIELKLDGSCVFDVRLVKLRFMNLLGNAP